MLGHIWDDKEKKYVRLFMLDKHGNEVPCVDDTDDFDNISAIPANEMDWNTPRRPWLFGNRLLRGQVSILAGMGGVGKTALTVTVALSLATGRNLLDADDTLPNFKLHEGTVKTYIYGLEDDLDEMKRRLLAVMNFHGITPSDLKDNLICGDGTIDRFIVSALAAGNVYKPPCVDKMVDYLIENNVGLLILDPFVKLHLCNENNNGQMDSVMVTLKEIAIKANCAIWLVHHSGKGGNMLDANGARGASSIVGSARINELLSMPTKKEAEELNLSPDVVKLEITKLNMSARGENLVWLRVSGYPVGNGDYAQVIELVNPSAEKQEIDLVLFDLICDNLRTPPNSKYWCSRQGALWAGQAFMAAGVTKQQQVKDMIREWMSKAILIPDTDAKDARNRSVPSAIKLNEIMAAKYRDQQNKA